MSKKTTLYLDDRIYMALQVQAISLNKTISETASALISQGLTAGTGTTSPEAKVHLRFEGKMGFPVLTLKDWPAGYVFDRELS